MSKKTTLLCLRLLILVLVFLAGTKVMNAIRTADKVPLAKAFDNFAISFEPADLAGSAGLTLLAAAFIFGGNQKKNYRTNEYGSARWGSKADIKPYIDPDPENNMILTQTESLTMNERPRNPETARNKNVMVVGGSGSGKTRFFIKPNIMQCCSEKYPCSFVVTDPKGSLAVECGKMLLRHGYRVKIFNTINFKKSMHYNPLAYIKDDKDILTLITTLMANTKGEGTSAGEDFWVKAEQLLLMALIGYVHYELPEEEQNFATILELLGNMKVSEDDEEYMNPVDILFEELREKDPNHFAVKQYDKYKLAAGKTAKSILISVGARLAPFDIGGLRELTMDDELELDTLGDSKQALFFIISDTDKTYNFIVSIAYTQMFHLLCKKADDEYNGRLPIHVRCLLDEFANIGQIPDFEKLIATIRSRRISAAVVLQAQSQLKAIYKDNADTIIGNMDTSIFLGGKEPSTLKALSESLGKQTIDTYNTGETRGREKSSSKNDQKLGRELMTPDELERMPRRECILQVLGLPPFKSKKYDITKHPRYKELADADPANALDIENYLKRVRNSTKLKLNPDDRYIVIDGDEDLNNPNDSQTKNPKNKEATK
ncbi:MAG: type IV secretory system conjugative DNA transfer family protein [Clostridia bacterium]|nr:type IV secretory system conjugative DNA transfer family protein [Clostridia bacterium]